MAHLITIPRLNRVKLLRAFSLQYRRRSHRLAMVFASMLKEYGFTVYARPRGRYYTYVFVGLDVMDLERLATFLDDEGASCRES